MENPVHPNLTNQNRDLLDTGNFSCALPWRELLPALPALYELPRYSVSELLPAFPAILPPHTNYIINWSEDENLNLDLVFYHD